MDLLYFARVESAHAIIAELTTTWGSSPSTAFTGVYNNTSKTFKAKCSHTFGLPIVVFVVVGAKVLLQPYIRTGETGSDQREKGS